jgi:hypothetical protein
MRLSATDDVNCTRCHADLQTKAGDTRIESTISSFEGKHPEFRALRTGSEDPGHIKLNHYAHMQPNLMGPNQTRVQMTCDDCHRTATDQDSLPYAGSGAQLQFAALRKNTASAPLAAANPRAYLAPPDFAKHCAGCHLLTFDRRFGNDFVPHDKPEAVHNYLASRFREYIAAHPASVREIDKIDRELPGRPNALKIARNADEWVNFRVEDAEWLLYRKTCKQCHTILHAQDALPEIAKPQITRRWLPLSEFDHHAHRAVTCGSCHRKAINSRETTDVLIPGIASCRDCHREGGPAREAAEGRCFECHQYHDWSKAKRTKGTYTIPELRGRSIWQLPSR